MSSQYTCRVYGYDGCPTKL